MLAALVAVTAQRAEAQPTAVTACGQGFAGEGELVADLDCTAVSGPAVFISHGGILYLRGFTLRGGIRCTNLPGRDKTTCTIEGPGVMTDGTVDTDPACGTNVDCADIASGRLPRLRDTSCETSRNTAAGGIWGVCVND